MEWHDRSPAGADRPLQSAEDVVAAVNFAREEGLRPTMRGGAHGVAGHAVCDNGLMIDLSLMNSVTVDPAARVARVGPGAVLGDMDAATQKHGLATTGGVDSRTGVAGLTLGGGMGWLARSFGLALDNLIALEVVTADGQHRSASNDENPDLFWALRGGGGRFGVVTAFEFQLHKVGPEVAMAQVFHPGSDAAGALRFFRDYMAKAPDQVGAGAMVMTVPPVEPFPEDHHGKTAVALVGCYSGAMEEGMQVLQGIREYGNPILDVLTPIPYADLQQSFDQATPEGARYYWKSQYLSELSDEAIDTLVTHMESLPGPFTTIAFECMGGAISRVDPAETAFPHRKAPFNFGVWAGWAEPEYDDIAIGWTRKLHEAMTPYSTGGVYANYLDHDDSDKMKAAFGENHDRLQAIKKKYDPYGLFRIGGS
ncbi:FAD-binding oxidoreductase [Alkalisalibacterium limincola]|uniref:FAD-binding oxidoreductase n=1 Tax=Alkalisalibacterium limincola TaxID=2699169 RepID=UPI001C9CB013|nr:FAD-binding oxidoreductase [Alkalisalibacterium limincola]